LAFNKDAEEGAGSADASDHIREIGIGGGERVRRGSERCGRKYLQLGILGTKRFSPVGSTAFCVLRTLGASAREDSSEASSHESSNARAKEAELVVELPPSEENITVVEGLAEIKLIEGIAFGT